MNRLSSMFVLAGLVLSPLTHVTSQWTQRQLPIQGDVWGLARRDSFVFAGTEIGFQGPGYVFRSTDDGETWNTVGGLPYAGGWSFAFSDSTLIAGSFGWGGFLSTDLGNTWTMPDSGIPPNANIHVLLKKGAYVFAATGGAGAGIFRSSDDGRHWITVDSGLTTLSFLSLATNGQDLYAGTSFTGQVFRSTNDGVNWFATSNGLPANSFVAVLAVRGSSIYAGLGSGEGVYYSSDNGTTWANISTSAPISQVWTLALVDTNLFVGSIGTGVFLTQNNGTSWIAVNEGLTSLNPRSLLISGNRLFAGTTNGYVCHRPLSEMITDVRETDNRPSAYSLAQCYPNPFNPKTTIEFSLPRASETTLRIFTSLGQEITTLVSEHLQPGQYKIDWNASHVASGVYYYRLEADNFVATRKLVLLK